jgi:hypothetical protein
MFVEIVPMTIQTKICIAFMINYDELEDEDDFLKRVDFGPQDFERGFFLVAFPFFGFDFGFGFDSQNIFNFLSSSSTLCFYIFF